MHVLAYGDTGGAYNIGNEDAIASVRELAEILVELSNGSSRLEFNHDRDKNYMPSSVSRIVPDTSKLRKLGWCPNISLREGFSRTIKFYENNI